MSTTPDRRRVVGIGVGVLALLAIGIGTTVWVLGSDVRTPVEAPSSSSTAPLVTPSIEPEATAVPEIAATAAPQRRVKKAVPGVLDERTFRRVINGRMSAFRLCYERQARRTSSLGGRLTVQVSIGSSGAVTSAAIRQDTLGNAAVSQCVRTVARGLRFPAPGSPVTYSFPFVFQSAE